MAACTTAIARIVVAADVVHHRTLCMTIVRGFVTVNPFTSMAAVGSLHLPASFRILGRCDSEAVARRALLVVEFADGIAAV